MNGQPAGWRARFAERVGGFYTSWINALSRRRVLLTVLLLAAGVVGGPLSARIRWEPNVLHFFSSSSREVESIKRAAATHGLANQLRLDVHAAPGTPADKAALQQAARELARRLRETGLFADVWLEASQERLLASYAQTMREAPVLLDEAMLQEMDKRLDGRFLEARFAQAARRVVDPDGEAALRQVQHDPLDIAGLVTKRLQASSPAAAATLDNGMLVSGDGQHVLLVAEPKCLPADQQGAEAVIAAIEQAAGGLKSAPYSAEVWTIGSHRAYVENARRVVVDVRLVSIAGTLAVALSIMVFFRRWAPALICLISPTLGVGLAMAIFGAFGARLPLIVLGFGGLICGYTTDYGIQLIAACRRRLTAREGEVATQTRMSEPPRCVPALAARELFGPISMSAATNVCGFGVLVFCNAQGLRALGLFVAVATFCIWAVTFLIMPAYIGPWVIRGKQPSSSWRVRLWQSRPLRIGAAMAFFIATAWLARYAWSVRFNASPQALDGSSPAMREQEKRFYEVWGDFPHRGIVLIQRDDPDALLTLAHRVDRALAQQQADGMIDTYYSPAWLLPDAATAGQRLDAWAAFWTTERRATAARLVSDAAQKANLRPAAWQPWLDSLPERPGVRPTDQRLADCPLGLFPGVISPDRKTLAIVVQMRRDVSPRMACAWAGELRMRFNDIVVLSGDALFFDANERARAEAETLAPLTILAIVLPLWFYFRRIALTAAASLCLIAGSIWLLGSAQAFLGGLNLLCAVPILFTLGVVIDYGIYTASDPAVRAGATDPGRQGATFLCALTTVLGSGSLIFASHPVLRWLGVTLVAGVLGGYMAGPLVVAPIARWLHRPKRRGWLPATFRLIGRAVLTVPVLLLCIFGYGYWRTARTAPPGAKPCEPVALVQTGDSSWQAGDAWMRRRDGIWELRVGGSPEEIGYRGSLLSAPIDLRIENEMLDQLDTMLPNIWARWCLTRAVGLNFISLPACVSEPLQREIAASAQGYDDPHAYLAPTFPRLLGYHALHDVSQMLVDNPMLVSPDTGCTGVIALPEFAGDGHLWIGRNFDFEAGETFARHKSITYCRPSEGIPFVSVAWPGLSGCVTGMNQEHIALFINAGATTDFRRVGTPTILMARQVLQHAVSIDQALTIIRSTTVFVSDSIIIADGKTGMAVIVEKSPAKTAVRDVFGSAVVTNHFVSPEFAGDSINKDRLLNSTSAQRMARADELLKSLRGKVDQKALVALLRDKKGVGGKDLGLGNRKAIDGLIACHGVVMDVTAGRMWVGDWPCVEGAFVYVDAMRMLGDSAGGYVHDRAMNIAADPIMASGQWESYQASRKACRLAVESLARKDSAAAISHAREGVAANPSFYYGHELLGRALFASGDRAAAKAEFDTALKLDPPYASRRSAIEKAVQECSRQ